MSQAFSERESTLHRLPRTKKQAMVDRSSLSLHPPYHSSSEDDTFPVHPVLEGSWSFVFSGWKLFPALCPVFFDREIAFFQCRTGYLPQLELPQKPTNRSFSSRTRRAFLLRRPSVKTDAGSLSSHRFITAPPMKPGPFMSANGPAFVPF